MQYIMQICGSITRVDSQKAQENIQKIISSLIPNESL